MKASGPTRWTSLFLWGTLLVYLLGRVCQLYADRLPSLLIVLLHVVPPAAFALVHGSLVYRYRRMLIFTALCLGVAGLSESLSLRTGFPFGDYYFTDVMGPRISHLPILLVLAYLGIGYCSWVLSMLLLGNAQKPIAGIRVLTTPLLASFIMLAWDLSMEADWSTIDRAWIWRHGGPFFGVPWSNFAGWYLTAYLFYQAFAFYCSRRPGPTRALPRSYWRCAILLYGICAGGNLLILQKPMAPPVVIDASGRRWSTATILQMDAMMSIFVMGPLALLAWSKAGR